MLAFIIGIGIGLLYVFFAMPNAGNKMSFILSYGYIVLSGYAGIPLVYKTILKIKNLIIKAFSVFTFGLWFFIPVSYSFILLVWVFALAIGLVIGMIISIPMAVYYFVQWLRKH